MNVGVGFRTVSNTVSRDFTVVSNSGSGIQLPHFEWRLDAFRSQQIANPVVEVVISLINECCGVILRGIIKHSSAVSKHHPHCAAPWFRFTLFEIETCWSYNNEMCTRQVDGVDLYHVVFGVNTR